MGNIKDYEPLWGSWYVDSLLGKGAYGEVYKVYREEFGKRYESAVKMISIPQNEEDLRQIQSEGLDSASARSYFQTFASDIAREIEFMNEFRGNSNIVSLEDHKVVEKENEIGWYVFIRMELLTPLSKYVTEKPLNNNDVIKLGIHICKALELCALKNTIHRDIKPDNIFVSQYGDFKLGDFGIARQVERSMSVLSKKGTENYMAPEVFKGDKYDASVDLYSLGIVMYRFLNDNRFPFLPKEFTADDRDEAKRRRMTGEAIPPIEGIDPKLNRIVLKACAYDRADRFNNPTEMRMALTALIAKNGFLEDPATPQQQIQILTETAQDESNKEPTMKGVDDDEKTLGMFSSKIEPLPMEEPESVKKPLNKLKILAIAGEILFGLLTILTFFSGHKGDIIIFAPIYTFCAVQCATKFREKSLNIIFLLLLTIYLLFSVIINLRSLDYSVIIMMLSLLTLETIVNEKIKYTTLLCIVNCFCTIACAMLCYYNRNNFAYSEIVQLSVLSILFAFFIPTGILLKHRGSIGYGLLLALHLFPLIAFITYISGFMNSSSMFFYIADTNFIGFSPERFSWWRYGRFLGLILQFLASCSILAIVVNTKLPEQYKNSFEIGKFFITFILIITVILIALVVTSMFFSFTF